MLKLSDFNESPQSHYLFKWAVIPSKMHYCKDADFLDNLFYVWPDVLSTYSKFSEDI